MKSAQACRGRGQTDICGLSEFCFGRVDTVLHSFLHNPNRTRYLSIPDFLFLFFLEFLSSFVSVSPFSSVMMTGSAELRPFLSVALSAVFSLVAEALEERWTDEDDDDEDAGTDLRLVRPSPSSAALDSSDSSDSLPS